MLIKSEGNNRHLCGGTRNGPRMKRMGTSEEVADAVIWLCSDAASFVTGHALMIDGGYTAQLSLPSLSCAINTETN